MFRYILFFVIFVWCSFGYAQVNIEGSRIQDKRGLTVAGDLGLDIKAGNTEVLELSTIGRIDHVTEKNHVLLLGEYERGEAQDELFKKSALFHARNTYMFSWVGVEGFLQSQRNDFNDLSLRQLLGGGVRFEYKKKTAKNKLLVALGLGAMAEYEELLSQQGEGWLSRSTNYVSVKHQFKEIITFYMVGYYQPKIQDVDDFRLLLDMGLEVKMVKKFSVVNSFILAYDSRPPIEVQNHDIGNSTRFKFTF